MPFSNTAIIILICLAALVALIVFVLMLRASLTVEYKEKLRVYASVLGIRFKLWPWKKEKYRLSDYTEKKIQKRLEKKKKQQAEKDERAAKRKAQAEANKDKKINKEEVLDVIDTVLYISKAIIKRFSGHLHIKLSRLNINVATPDAAATAILYGAVAQGVAYIIEYLDCVTNIKVRDININADFISEKTTIDIKITFGLRVWQVIDLSIHGLFRFLDKKYFNK